MENWKTLIQLLEKHEACSAFTAECVYAYIVNYGMDHPGDNELLSELVKYLEMDE